MTDSPEVLLLDIGGVLIENVMFDELQRLTGANSQAELKVKWLHSRFARRFELGEIANHEFANGIIGEFELELTPQDFIAKFAGWPRDYYPGALRLIAELRKNHRVCALTNCNAIHWSERLTTPFERTFSSHLMGAIKPRGVRAGCRAATGGVSTDSILRRFPNQCRGGAGIGHTGSSHRRLCSTAANPI